MSIHIEDTEFKALRSIVRFVGMGVMPSTERAEAALDTIDTANASQQLASVRQIAETVLQGALPRQELCIQANKDLERLMYLSDSDGVSDRNVPGA